ncbi:histone-lysine N-methyltransferase ASHR3 [Sesamum indicum]|uniref:Histone-lysine N-methyltransferase ASHR3 n=1 Tax=Sesamum indicum TaxID=4182 RepID=A0A6I9SKD7_SESIN|nr:histone-lysine N-methyltransferase ASHR3 [Sesamum indicum]
MPCLGNLLNSPASALELTPYPKLKPVPQEIPLINPAIVEPEQDEFKLGTLLTEFNDDDKRGETTGNGGEGGLIEKIRNPEKDFGSLFQPKLRLSEAEHEDGGGIERGSKPCRVKWSTTAKLVQEWSKRKIEQGVPEFKVSLPFLVGAPKLVQCSACQTVVYHEEEILCSVRGCRGVFHLKCAKETLGFSSSKQFKCPQHECFLCKQKNRLWRCLRCPIACHDKCAPFPEHVVHFPDQPGEAICWRHPTDWRLEKKHGVPAKNMEDIFSLLPLPYNEEEFKIDINWKDQTEMKLEPHPYVHIKRNVYLVKRKRNSSDADIGCTNCSSTQCSEGCVCRVQCISCSKACSCSKQCANRPFQKVKKIQIVKTQRCGWGVVAAESINKGDFIVEYVGEVIDDALCERRLWDMKDQDAKNFYMCEINKDFVIDATFKGNASRFLNHSCAPNCVLEKWQVEGETRVGVFASRSIEVGEPLTYDYRFVQFGPEVECHCGAPNCQGYLGTKRKIVFGPRTKRRINLGLSWGPKRQRTSKKIVGIVIN